MAFADTYRNQVALLIRTLPSVAVEECFAMKGGTAINLFVRDLPRLSVDIDLTYLPVQDRATSLATIDAVMARIAGPFSSISSAMIVPWPRYWQFGARTSQANSRAALLA